MDADQQILNLLADTFISQLQGFVRNSGRC
jgi:hypothetical protein